MRSRSLQASRKWPFIVGLWRNKLPPYLALKWLACVCVYLRVNKPKWKRVEELRRGVQRQNIIIFCVDFSCYVMCTCTESRPQCTQARTAHTSVYNMLILIVQCLLAASNQFMPINFWIFSIFLSKEKKKESKLIHITLSVSSYVALRFPANWCMIYIFDVRAYTYILFNRGRPHHCHMQYAYVG